MTLVHWHPWQDMDNLQAELNQLFYGPSSTQAKRSQAAAYVPAAELTETEDALLLKLELPGFNAEDLEIEVTAKSVSVKGDRKAEAIAEATGLRRSEFNYGRYERVIALPKRVQNTQVQATYKNGILALTLPKSEEEKNKVYRVQLADTDAATTLQTDA